MCGRNQPSGGGSSRNPYQNSSIISRGYTDTEGNIILTLPQSMTPNNCVLTVSKHDFKPLQQTLTVDKRHPGAGNAL